MQVFLYFARAYPIQNLIVLVCLLLAALTEGIGWSAALPLLSVAIEEPGATAPSGYHATVLAVLDRLGIPHGLEPLLLVLVGTFAAKGLLLLWSKRRVGYMVAHVATDLRLGLLRALLGTRWSYYTKEPVGLAANAMSTEATRAAHSYYYLAQVFTAAIQALLVLAIAIAVSWQATLAVSAAGAITVGTLNVFVRKSTRAGRRQTALLKSLLGRLTDMLGAVKLLKAMGREPLVGPLLELETRQLNKALKRQVLNKEALRALQEPVMVGFIALGLYVCLRPMGMALAETTVLLFLLGRSLGAINRAQRKWQYMLVDESALWSLRERIDEAERQREPAAGSRTPHLNEAITLHNVAMDYDGKTVFEALSMEIPAGSITAILGASGAGKTTIVDLITGLVHPKGGRICVDDVSIDDLDLRAWRHMIGYVPQEMLLLHDSVRTNVSLGDPEISDADVERALREADAWDYVQQLPGGLDASVGERGALLSGGQRQRIAIARAIVHRPQLLILDEATAALDAESEAAVWATVENLRGKNTVVAISHQQALADVADRIYRIENHTAKLVPVAATTRATADGVG